MNGIFGLRATPGRIPAVNATVPVRFAGLQFFSAQGVLARRVNDVALGLRAMSAKGDPDPTWVNAPLDHADDAIPCRVAYVSQLPNTEVSPHVHAALGQASATLAAAGYQVEEATPPGLDQAQSIWLTVAMSEVRLGMLADVHATADAAIMASVEAMADCAGPSSLEAYALALAQRDALRRRWQAFLQRYPLILMPTSAAMPMAWDADLQGTEPMRRILINQLPLMAVAALGLPGLNVPTGVVQGVPTGVQLVAGAFREQRLLAAGRVIERATAMPVLWQDSASPQRSNPRHATRDPRRRPATQVARG